MRQRFMRLFSAIMLTFALWGLVVAGGNAPPAFRLSRARLFSGVPDIVWTAGGNVGSARAVAFSPNGQILVTGNLWTRDSIKFWRVSDGALVQTYDEESDVLYTAALSA